MCLDFDHIENMEEVKQQILNHEYFDTELLFTSPSGNGLKWIIPVDLKGWEHSRFFKAVANCIRATGLPKVDMSGSDVRAPVSCLTTHKHILTLNTTSMSKKIFSAQDWENVPFENSVPTSPKLLPATNPTSNKEEEIERIIAK